ncbi:PucR family transcriptional regulator [Streptomyces sp. NPDC059037]|uniref:PucR family transcriptional regulator n=1 Tax=Streptomyces sp. NPDC059037 TaxID=3346710 RepID=UPI00369688D6
MKEPQPYVGIEGRGGRDAARTTARERLVDLLTGCPVDPPDTVEALVGAAEWRPPAVIQAVAVVQEAAPPPALEWWPDALVGRQPEGTVLLLPDPEENGRALLARALHGRTASVGPVVRLSEVAASLRWARQLLALAPERSGPGTRLMYVEDHLAALLLLQDEALARFFASRRLRPLRGLSADRAERFAETLLAWLRCGGATGAAQTLEVHPQTIRYRMRQIEALFGPELRDPKSRFELELALRSGRLVAEARQIRFRARG